MEYDGQGLGKRRQGIMIPIVVALRVKHEGLGFDGKREIHMTMKTAFVKAKDMTELVYSLEGIVVVNEGGNPIPPQPSYGGLKKGSDEKSSKTRPTPSL
jgi:hypothetical protein